MKKYISNLFSSMFKNEALDVNSEKLNLKEYYWDLKTFVQPKVLVFNVENDDVTALNYIEFKKIGESLLQMTTYNNEFTKTKVLVQRFKEHGVYVDSISFVTVGNPKQLTTPDILSGFVFPFKSPEVLREEYVYNDHFDEPIVINQNQYRNFINYNDLDPDILKTEGRMHKGVLSKDGELISDYYCTTETHYKKGFGIIYTSAKDDIGHFKREYSKTITVKEFNALKEKI